jgi:hypothetical protein
MSKVFFTNSYQGRSFVVTPDLGFNPPKERDGNCLRAKKEASRKCPQTAKGARERFGYKIAYIPPPSNVFK